MQTTAAPGNLGGTFKTRFEVIPALTDALKDEVYRLRHSVYCEDLHWESVRSDGREIDAYDAQSIALLMKHVGTGEYVGCARLVRPSVADPAALLPFETFSQDSLDLAEFDFASAPREQVAEVSRLAASRNPAPPGEARRAASSSGTFRHRTLPRFPYLIGLFSGSAIAGCTESKRFLSLVSHVLRITSELGVEIRQIGNP